MDSADSKQARWDQRYRDASATDAEPAGVLSHYRHWLPARGRALDLACGLGGNALLLAAAGLETEAWDLSPVALEALAVAARGRGLQVRSRRCDVSVELPAQDRYDVIVVSHFLERDLFPALKAALRPGGLLYYQTFTIDARAGPGNPAFRLGINELLQRSSGLTVRAYHEEAGLPATVDGRAGQAWLVAQKPGEDR